MKLIIWIIAAIVTLAVTAFAVSNRAPVEVDFWPLPYAAILPLFAVLLVAVVLGFLFGAITTWWSGRKWRRGAREARRENDHLRRELEAVKRAASATEPGRSPLPSTNSGAPPSLPPSRAAQG
ncbi:MAG: LapA family protein [Alphaproteobacteria bacterium]|nr:LapA family protein [Alphaproteobacteria bacterium]